MNYTQQIAENDKIIFKFVFRLLGNQKSLSYCFYYFQRSKRYGALRILRIFHQTVENKNVQI